MLRKIKKRSIILQLVDPLKNKIKSPMWYHKCKLYANVRRATIGAAVCKYFTFLSATPRLWDVFMQT